ncbi:glycosyltransferase family 4 protein [Sphingomonas qomolangmaensis]|uniref:Glycosyltransferase family 4 protein n=1 Tax=Sphingomonas qomolangmaensis TaxID=2918765 RepID=A0ABY5L8J6_9SPHN|nr:glycosyltransferase family 1 protein [Sphingomonas qomolangmaensis]UUL82172.1 glycosyltransferase family 4 protein [Sphingomonas qomolangmaensis]
MTVSPADASLRSIHIDVTETLATGKWTGIERVVRKLVAALGALEAEGGPQIHPVASIEGRFYRLNAEGLARLGAQRSAAGTGSAGALVQFVGKLLTIVPPVYVVLQAKQKQRKFEPLLRPFLEVAPASFGPHDAILLLDSYWAGVSSIAAAASARRDGAIVVSALYDIIPITHPKSMPSLMTLVFPRHLNRALAISDGVVAISRQSARELRTYLGARLPKLPIHWFHLGNDNAPGPARTHRAGGPFRYAIVGTIEPRKGHDRVLDAFERRWATGSPSKLTIIGKLGWASPDMKARLDNHPERGARLAIVHDASDSDLATILGSTDAVILASQVEGFGLPIIEAFARDIPVIASDIPIFREVGGDAIAYFDVGDASALPAAIAAFEADPDIWRARAAAFTWPDWNTAAGEVLTAIRAIADGEPNPGNA